MIQNIQHFTWKTQLFLKPCKEWKVWFIWFSFYEGWFSACFLGEKICVFFFFGAKSGNLPTKSGRSDGKGGPKKPKWPTGILQMAMVQNELIPLQKWRIPKPRYVWKLYKWCQRLIFLGPSGVPIFSPEGQTSSNLSSYPSRRSAFRQWNFGIER